MHDDIRPPKKPDEYPEIRLKTPPDLAPDSVGIYQAPAAPQPIPVVSPEPASPIFAMPPVMVSDKPSSGKGRRRKFSIRRPQTKKEWLIVAGVLLLIGGGAGAFALTQSEPPKPATSTPKAKKIVPPPAPKTVASTLSGLQVDPAINLRPVTGVMIENSQAARPQSGLGQASVVFEAIAEGGITRFLALYQDTDPANIGPVRSARPYYLQWALGFDAGYAHVGGSPDALASIKAWSVKDLDQFANSGAYRRIPERYAPHNVYTTMAQLHQLQAAKGFTTSTFTGFARKPAADPQKDVQSKAAKSKKKAAPAPAPVPTAKSINFAISGPLYNVHYDYIAATNSYARSEGGAPHIEANTNTQISPNVVIALVMPYSITGGKYSNYQTIGSGAAYIFQDGMVTIGQWAKPADRAQFTFTDSAGKPLLLNPGSTWLTALGNATAISYTP